MKEDFLHYIWKHKLFDTTKLTTTQNEVVVLLSSGKHNVNTGPDFFNAKLHISDQLWAGNVEIHVRASDWYIHGHEKDKNYDSIILHVVWEDDAEIYRKNNSKIPTLELQNFINDKLLTNYKKLFLAPEKWINCEKEIGSIPQFELSNWLERLYIERLEQKSIHIQQLLDASKNNWEAVLFKMLAKSFGLKVNGDAFLNLANSLDFSIIRKESHQLKTIEALLFGQAGLLDNTIQDGYYQSLQQEYAYLKDKYKLRSLSNSQFQFFRLRPNNFPTIRIAQLASLLHVWNGLFLKIIETKSIDKFYDAFVISISPFWKTHYSFTSISKSSSKKLSKPFIDLVLINTIIPLKFIYLKYLDKLNVEELLDTLRQIRPEKNTIISKFNTLGIVSDTAFESQALLQLKNRYCMKQRCLECEIGNRIIIEGGLF